jgi:ribosome-binding factor A
MVQRRRSGGKSSGGAKKFPRVARVNESLREVIAEEMEQIDDDRLFLCTITGIDVDPDLRHATVFYSVMDPSATDRTEATQASLEEHRAILQKAIGRELILKRTPLLTFVPDSGVANGARIESIIATMPRSPEGIDYGLDEPVEPAELN